MGQIARRQGEDDQQGDEDGTAQPVDPHRLVIEGPDGSRLVVVLPDIPSPRQPG